MDEHHYPSFQRLNLSLALNFYVLTSSATIVSGHQLKLVVTFFCICCFSEHIKILHSTGTEVFKHEGCQSSLPSGTSLEVPIGTTDHIILEIVLEYRWSVVNLEYDILSQGLDSGLRPEIIVYFLIFYFPIYFLNSLQIGQVIPSLCR